MTDTLSWEKFTLYVPRLVLAIVDALHAALDEHGQSHRLYEIYDDGSALIGLEFGPALFVGSPTATELQRITMSSGEMREDEFLLMWDLDALPTLGDLCATFGMLAELNPHLYVDQFEPADVLMAYIADPFAVPPLELLDDAPLSISEPLDD